MTSLFTPIADVRSRGLMAADVASIRRRVRDRISSEALHHASIAEALTTATRSIPDLPAVAAAGRPSPAQETTSHA